MHTTLPKHRLKHTYTTLHNTTFRKNRLKNTYTTLYTRYVSKASSEKHKLTMYTLRFETYFSFAFETSCVYGVVYVEKKYFYLAVIC